MNPYQKKLFILWTVLCAFWYSYLRFTLVTVSIQTITTTQNKCNQQEYLAEKKKP